MGVMKLLFLLIICIVSNHFFYGQNNDASKNPISTNNFLISTFIFNPHKKVNFSSVGSIPKAESLNNDLDFDKVFKLDDFEAKLTQDCLCKFLKSNVNRI